MRPTHTYRVASRSATSLAMAVACLALAAPARGAFVAPQVTIDVSAGGHSGSWQLDLGDPASPLDWHLAAPLDIYSSDASHTLLATIETLDLFYEGDPQVILNFSLTAGAAPTNVAIASGAVLFAPALNPTAFATAGMTVTDNNDNGGMATGNFAGAKSYEATYNGGATFADLISPIAAPLGDTGIGMERLPAAGSVVIPGVVSSIAAGYSFMLTAEDSASGTSRFSLVIPEPSTAALALLGIVALVSVRRRRR